MHVTADGPSFSSSSSAAPSRVSSSDDQNLSRFFSLNFFAPRQGLVNVYATTAVIAKYKLVPWSVDEGKAAVERVYKRYLAQHRDKHLDPNHVHSAVLKLVSDSDLFPKSDVIASMTSKAQRRTLGFTTHATNSLFKDSLMQSPALPTRPPCA